MQHTTRKFHTHDALALYLQHWLPDDAPKANLAVVHGLGEHSGRYADFAAWFVPLGYAVHAFDHRGHGKSPGIRGHVNRWAEFREDVRVFLKEVRESVPDVPTFLIGHSMGGLVVLNYGLHYSEGLQGLVSSAPILKLADNVSSVQLVAARVLASLLPKMKMSNGLDAAGLSRDPEVVRAYREDPLVHGTVTPRFGVSLEQAIDWTMSHASDWSESLPLLVVHGEADPICPIEGSKQFFANVPIQDKTYHSYPGYLHEVFNEQGREQVLSDVQAWLEAHWPS